MTFTTDTARLAGHMGGASLRETVGPDGMAARGSRGGKATQARRRAALEEARRQALTEALQIIRAAPSLGAAREKVLGLLDRLSGP